VTEADGQRASSPALIPSIVLAAGDRAGWQGAAQAEWLGPAIAGTKVLGSRTLRDAGGST